MAHKTILLLLRTACGLCFFSNMTGATQAIDAAKLEDGFIAGCLRQDSDCFYQNVQWRDADGYDVRETYLRRLRDSHAVEQARRWLSEAPFCPTARTLEQETVRFELATLVADRWRSVPALVQEPGGCLAPAALGLRPGDTLRLRVDARITARSDSFAAYAVRLPPSYPDRALIMLAPGASKAPVYVDLREEDGRRSDGELRQTHVLLREPSLPAAAIPMLAASTLPSWHALARLHRQREDSLLDADLKLPVFPGLSKRDVVERALRWLHARVRYSHDRFRDGAVFPEQSVSAMLGGGMADCKGIALLFRAVMKKNGIDVQTVAVSSAGRRPVSWRVPGAWANHVISYVPDLDLYLDAGVPLDIQNKLQGQERFRYEMGLNLATGEFGVIR